MKIYKLSEDIKGFKKGDIIVTNRHDIHQSYGDIKPRILWGYVNIPDEYKEELSDWDLYKISHHLLSFKKYNIYSTKKIVEDELIKRGFKYNEVKKKWFK
jgi:hypothetical protein